MDISTLISFFQTHEFTAYLVIFLGSYLDTLIGIGFFVYGEIFFLAGAILAGMNYLNIWIVALVCFTGGILADSSSYFIGKKYGRRAIKFIFKKGNRYLNPKNYKKAEYYFSLYGAKSVFFARFLGPVAWITPFLAGVVNLKYSRFLKYNIPGVILGISQFLVAGYLFGFSYLRFLEKTQDYIFFFLLTIIFIIIVYFVEKKFKFLQTSSKKIIRHFK